MMQVEFQSQMNRLIAQFGKQTYSTKRCALIWKEVSELDGKWWEVSVNKFIGEARQAPLIPEIREEVSRHREKIWNSQKKSSSARNYIVEPDQLTCTKCQDTGGLWARSKSDNARYVFRCDCSIGTKDIRSWPQWSFSFEESFEVER